MKADLVLGIDSSTTGCKAIVWDSQGRAAAISRSPLSLLTPHPLWYEQPAESWRLAAVKALREISQQVQVERIGALCISHQRETFVPVDKAVKPLRNAILWMDERAGELLPTLRERLDADHFHQITGKPLSGNLSAAKIAWLQENEPEIFHQTAMVLDVQAYLVFCLAGVCSTSWGSVDPMGLFDMRQNCWSGEILGKLGVDVAQMPSAFPPGALLGYITPQAASECALPAGLPVIAGLGDGQSAGLGTGIVDEETSYLSLGTSVVSGTLSNRFIASKNFRTMVAGLPGEYSLETVILGGAYTLDWLARDLFGVDRAVLEREASLIPPGAQGLVLLPYWNSAMNPYWDARASGVILGWRGVHQRQHVYRAALEGIAFEQRLHTQGIEEALNSKIKRYVVVGGGARSELWRQIIADVTGKQVFRATNEEASALGAGILAAAAVGLYEDVSQAARGMARWEETFTEPDAQRHEFYTRMFMDVYSGLYPALRETMSNLTLMY